MYSVINPATVGRATRDMSRLHNEIVQIAVEVANGLIDEMDAAKIEQALIEHKQLGDQLVNYVRAVKKQVAEEAAKKAEEAKKAAEAPAEENAEKPAAEEKKPAE